jgi:hypothetical protein
MTIASVVRPVKDHDLNESAGDRELAWLFGFVASMQPPPAADCREFVEFEGDARWFNGRAAGSDRTVLSLAGFCQFAATHPACRVTADRRYRVFLVIRSGL